MVLQIYQYSVDKNLGGKGLVNNVQLCLMTQDDGVAAAARLTAADDAVASALGGTYFQYFEDELLIAPAAAGAMQDDGDLVVQDEHQIVKVGVA